MATYVLMTKMETRALDGGRRERGQEWKAKVEALCPGLRWVAHFALLGPYDFMDVYEAPDEQTAFKVSLLSRAEGAIAAESWPAVRYDEFLPIFRAVEDVHENQPTAPRERVETNPSAH